jgi:hypothetical protein
MNLLYERKMRDGGGNGNNGGNASKGGQGAMEPEPYLDM